MELIEAAILIALLISFIGFGLVVTYGAVRWLVSDMIEQIDRKTSGWLTAMGLAAMSICFVAIMVARVPLIVN